MSDDACVVITTVATKEQAKKLAADMIEARLAACAQTIAISSCYRWDGKIVEDEEQMILFKTTSAAYAALESGILAGHPYDTPEVVRLPVTGGASRYLSWIAQEVDLS